MSSVVDTTWVLSDSPIRRGVDWGAGSGMPIVANEIISAVTFELVFKRNGLTVITLNEANGRITHSGSYTIYITISDTDTESLTTGLLVGKLIGTTVSGRTTYYGSIQVEVI